MTTKAVKVVVEGRSILVGRHAVERYQERCRTTLDIEQVRVELARVMRYARFVTKRPAWHRESAEHGRLQGEFVLLGDDILFPVIEGTLSTCITRGGLGEKNREARSQNRAERVETARHRNRTRARGRSVRRARKNDEDGRR